MSSWIGKLLIIVGILFVGTGILVLFKDSIPFLGNLGKLPGDINIERKNFSFHFPIVTSIIVSIILSIVLYVLSKFK
jgi:hypothetical protein